MKRFKIQNLSLNVKQLRQKYIVKYFLNILLNLFILLNHFIWIWLMTH